MNLDFDTLTLVEAAALLDGGACTAVELTAALAERIASVDPNIGAYLEVDVEGALEQARGADARRCAGERGPLLGIPVAVKDLLNVEGQACRCASRVLEGYMAPYDATAIRKLREAGAIFLGRTNMDEFAMGSSTENSAYGPTRNPADAECVPGGSSGGSAAAVAAGEALAALGTDTGGSIRQPAAFCGCVGLKPTYGRVSRYGLTAFASSLDQMGPMTRTVRDAAMLLGVMAGHDPLDATSLDEPVPDYTIGLDAGVRGMRLGLPREYLGAGIAPAVRGAVEAAIATLRQQGAEIVELTLPHSAYAIAVYYIIATAEASANLARFDGVRYGRRAGDAADLNQLYARTRAEGFGDEVKRRIILGTYVLSSGYYDAYYGRAQKVRTLIRGDFERAFDTCDAILSPVTPTCAFRMGEHTRDPLEMYLSDAFTAPVNLAGLCALSVPCAVPANELPVGLQVIGPAFGEPVVLRVGQAVEQAARGAAS